MTKRTVEEIQEEIKETNEKALAQPTLQEEVQRLYKRVCEELPPNGLFDDGFEHAFQALSEIIEYHGGGEHIDFL